MTQTQQKLIKELALIGKRVAEISGLLSGPEPAEVVLPQVRTAQELQSLIDAGKCPWCERAIPKGVKPRRSMHPACYQQIIDQKDEKGWSWEMLEKTNRVPKKKKSGKPKQYHAATELKPFIAEAAGKMVGHDMPPEEESGGKRKGGKK